MADEIMTTSRAIAAAFLTSFLLSAGVANSQQGAAAAKAGSTPSQKPGVGAEPLEITLIRRKVIIADGKETLQSAANAKPGEVLEEVVTYANRSGAPLKGLEATLPIPPNTELLVDSIRPGNAKASTDGGNFALLPLKRKIRQANGVETEQVVPPGEYRYLRWYPGELAAGRSVVFSARFKVSNDGVLAAPSGK